MSYALPFFRVPIRSSASFVLACEPHAIATHFFHRRLLCCGPGCPACVVDESRDFSYAFGRCLGDGKLYLLEVPATTFGCIQRSITVPASRIGAGAEIVFSRKHKKAPVFGDWTDQVTPPHVAPSLTLPRILLASFGLGSCSEECYFSEAILRAKPRIHRRLFDAMRQFGYSTDPSSLIS